MCVYLYVLVLWERERGDKLTRVTKTELTLVFINLLYLYSATYHMSLSLSLSLFDREK
ncbi:hypothetical protein BDV25DRAFT_159091 [Aspergillus avenaceus]|uniref:Uncharacterized protein n=1 Tax=Aspergillus avenaceus TaxID=36643 RepID=A0A5N6TNX7_ASPAV|nr:hypothetical protein BDV25DRAFT_159091 [Aspergillus avenaceus]